MNRNLKYFPFVGLLVLAIQPLTAHNGNEEGQNLERNTYEYNLYDRNYDRIRGRGIYENEDRAYPNEQFYRNPHLPEARQRQYPEQPD